MLFYTPFNLPFGVFVMRNSFHQIPKEIEECARVDGASLWTTLEMRSSVNNDRPTALLGFDETFLRPFARALVEAATTLFAGDAVQLVVEPDAT